MYFEFMSAQKNREILGVHPRTLYNWEKGNKINAIKTPGGKRLYNISSFIIKNPEYKNMNEIIKIKE